MNGMALLMFLIIAIIVLIIAVPVLLGLLWLVNRLFLGGRISFLYRLVISIVLPLLFLGGLIAYSYFEPYSTSRMNDRLEVIGVGVKLPKYKITNHVSAFAGGDDIQETYTIEFKDDVRQLIPKLDSLCNTSENWTKDGNSYIYKVAFFEQEVEMTLTINPNSQTAEFVRVKW